MRLEKNSSALPTNFFLCKVPNFPIYFDSLFQDFNRNNRSALFCLTIVSFFIHLLLLFDDNGCLGTD